jgi:hypothetical protein
MDLFSIVTLILSSMIVGIVIGRTITKAEFGKMLMWLEESGCLHRPCEDTDDEEDIK